MFAIINSKLSQQQRPFPIISVLAHSHFPGRLKCSFDEHTLQRSKEIFNIKIVSVKSAIILHAFESPRHKLCGVVVPDFPQLKAEVINCTEGSPATEDFLRCFGFALNATRVEFDHQLFDVGQTSWIGKYSVERSPFRTLDINLQNVDRRLQNIERTH